MQSFLSIYGVFSAFLFFLSGFIFFKVTPDLAKKSEYYIFRTFILAFLFYLIMNVLWTLQEYHVVRMARGLYIAVCFLSYFCVVSNAFCFYAFTMVHFNFQLGKKLYATVLGMLPLAAAVVLLLVSLKTGIIFSVDENGHLTTGPAYLALAACAFAYFAVIFRVAIFRVIKGKNRYVKREGLVLAGCVVFLVGWVLLDDLFEKITIIPIAIYSVINFLFVHLLSSQVYTDALTKMNNRRKSEEYLAARVESVSEQTPLLLFMADVNSFKTVNDTYGHREGDAVLVLVADGIKRVMGKYNGFSARYGGDEFVWAIEQGKGKTFLPEEIAAEVQESVNELVAAKEKPYSVSLCMGYVLCADPKRGVSEYISEADEMLYRNKSLFHGEKKESRK